MLLEEPAVLNLLVMVILSHGTWTHVFTFITSVTTVVLPITIVVRSNNTSSSIGTPSLRKKYSVLEIQ